MSAKTSTTPGRRTPMSLSGTVTKGQPPNKGGNMAHNSGGNANGNFAASNTRQDNKQQQQSSGNQSSDINKKQNHIEKRPHHQNDNKKLGPEKSQNGVNNKQQQSKEKQHQNGNDGKLSEKDKIEKSEKQDIPEKQDKTEKQDKPEKGDKSENEDKTEKQNKLDKEDKPDMEEPQPKDVKNDQESNEANKEDKNVKEVKEDKNNLENKIDEKQENIEQTGKTVEETKSKDLTESKFADAEKGETVKKIEVQKEEEQQQQKTPPVTPKSNNKGSKTSTPSHKTPAKASEKTPPKSVTTSKSFKTMHIVTREVTTAIDVDVEMEPLAVENSPVKASQYGEVPNINIPLAPTATSTPGKLFLPKIKTTATKSDVQLAMLTGLSVERPKTFSHISGRKSIRPVSDYTPSKFQSNSQFRESYRRINTELDATNTSLNVTVGSEVPNNASFSFFGRGRKRDRTPPQHSQSAIGELQTDMEISPPKKARYDMQGFFHAVSSPLSLLRNRFSKATLQSSTPVKLEEKLNSAEDEIEVQNVSGVSIHEEIDNTENDSENTTANSEGDATLGVEASGKQVKNKQGIDVATEKGELQLEDEELKNISSKIETTCAMESEQSDIKITETPLHPAVGDPMTKNKRCVVM